MKSLVFGVTLCGVSLFVAGCNDTAKQKDTSQRTVETDKSTGETVIKDEEKHTGKDSETGEKVETSVEKEATVKPAQENETAPADETATDNAPATPEDK